MALQATKGLILNSSAGQSYTAMLLDAATEKVAFIIRVPKDGTLDSVGFRLGTVTQAPTNGLKVSFQDVSLANGDPDGTIDQYAVVTAGLVSNAWIDVSATGYMGSGGAGSGTKRSVSRGNYLAVVTEYQSFNAGDSLNVNHLYTITWVGNNYADLFTAAWVKQTAGAPVLSLKYEDGSYDFMPEAFPHATESYTSYHSGSTPDEIALKFKVPYSVKVNGLWFFGQLATGPADLVLYDSDGATPLASASMDNDAAIAGNRFFWVPIPETTLSKETFYYIALKPTTASYVNLFWFTVNAAAIFDQTDLGQNAFWSQRTDAGAWSDTTTKRPYIGAVISALDDGTGGGGAGISRGRVQGGM